MSSHSQVTSTCSVTSLGVASSSLGSCTLDHAGPFLGKNFLVIVDAHSKWLEVIPASTLTSQTTIATLRGIFATHGLPEMLVSDNGPSFVSSEFQEFMQKNGIRHVKCAPYHPASNGLAEGAVQTFKEGLKKVTQGDIQTRLARFLFQYRITPHTTTGIAPAELMLGRRPRSHLDLLHPMLGARVSEHQRHQKDGHDQHAKSRQFAVDNSVYVHNLTQGPRWLPGVITAVRGPLSYTVTLTDGRVVRRHVDHVRKRTDLPARELDDDWVPDQPSSTDTTVPAPTVTSPAPIITGVRRSSRVCAAPDRFDPSTY